MAFEMNMLSSVILLPVGFLILIKGASLLVDGAVGLAERFGVSHFIIGLTVIAMGTSAPEVAASLSAALHDAGAERLKSRVYNVAGTASDAKSFASKVREHIPHARITFKPDPEAVALLGKGIESMDESAARSEWDWRISYDIDAMIEDMKADFAAQTAT